MWLFQYQKVWDYRGYNLICQQKNFENILFISLDSNYSSVQIYKLTLNSIIVLFTVFSDTFSDHLGYWYYRVWCILPKYVFHHFQVVYVSKKIPIQKSACSSLQSYRSSWNLSCFMYFFNIIFVWNIIKTIKSCRTKLLTRFRWRKILSFLSYLFYRLIHYEEDDSFRYAADPNWNIIKGSHVLWIG